MMKTMTSKQNEEERQPLLDATPQTNYGSTKQEVTSFLGGLPWKGQGFFNKFYRQSSQSLFQNPIISYNDDCFSMKFPIIHYLNQSKLLDTVDGISSESLSKKELKKHSANSYLDLKLTQEGDQWFVRVACKSCTDFYQYDLRDLLTVLFPNNRSFKPYSIEFGQDLIGKFSLNTSWLTTESHFYGQEVASMMHLINAFQANCLSRFKELTANREDEAFDNAIQLNILLDNLVSQRGEVWDITYQMVLQKLDGIENSETYCYDPQIILSLTPIRSVIEALRARALKAKHGVEISQLQLDELMNTLIAHEGDQPAEEVWLPTGSQEKIRLAFEEFIVNKISNNCESCLF